MKVRIISSLGGLGILFAVLSFYDTIVFNIALSVIAVLAVDEMLEASGIIRNLPLSATAFVFAGIIPFYNFFRIRAFMPALTLVVIIVMFCILLHQHQSTRIEQLSFSFLMAAMISISLTLLAVMRDRFGMTAGLFGTVVVLASAWMSDTGAYFAGVKFGKHKLAPLISPKKTIEGVVGGVIVAMLSLLAAGYLYTLYTARILGITIEINYLYLALISPLLTAISIIGDLSASVIKRQFGIKDFGKIMPGHGGVLDRFDSVLLVCPVVYFLMRWVPLMIVC